MRAAQDQHLGILVCRFPLKVLKVDLIAVSLFYQSTVHQYTVIILHGMVHGIVDGSHQHDPFSFLGIDLHRVKKSVDDPMGWQDPLRIGIPAVLLLHPPADRIQVVFGRVRIAHDRMVQFIFQRLHDLRRCDKFHIGYGKWDDILFFPYSIDLQLIPFLRTGMKSLMYGLKVIFLHLYILLI